MIWIPESLEGKAATSSWKEIFRQLPRMPKSWTTIGHHHLQRQMLSVGNENVIFRRGRLVGMQTITVILARFVTSRMAVGTIGNINFDTSTNRTTHV